MSHLDVESFPDRLQSFGATPFLGTIDFVQHPAISINQQGQRNMLSPQHIFHEQIAINVVGEGGVGFSQECQRPLPVVIRRYAYHIELLSPVTAGQPLQ